MMNLGAICAHPMEQVFLVKDEFQFIAQASRPSACDHGYQALKLSDFPAAPGSVPASHAAHWAALTETATDEGIFSSGSLTGRCFNASRILNEQCFS